MMKAIEKHNYSGWFALFGLPFFAGGLFFLYAIIEPTMKWSGDRPSLYFGIPFCSVFILIGALIIFGRTGYSFDPITRKGYAYWGLLFPIFIKRFRFEDIDHIVITHKVRRNKNRSYSIYPIKLIKNDKSEIDIESSGQNYLLARERAEKIARDCQFRFLNTKEDNQILNPNEVDKSFKDKLLAGVEEPSFPGNSDITYKQVRKGIKIKSSFNASWIEQMVPFIFSMLFYMPVGMFFIYFFDRVKDPIFQIAFVVFTCFPLLLLFVSRIISKSSGFEIMINSKSLTIKFKNLKRESKTIDISDIDEITTSEDNHLRPMRRVGFGFFKKSKQSIYIVAGYELIQIDQIKSKEDEIYLKDLILYSISRT